VIDVKTISQKLEHTLNIAVPHEASQELGSGLCIDPFIPISEKCKGGGSVTLPQVRGTASKVNEPEEPESASLSEPQMFIRV
jgi:hypothetical protein